MFLTLLGVGSRVLSLQLPTEELYRNVFVCAHACIHKALGFNKHSWKERKVQTKELPLGKVYEVEKL